MMCHWVVRREDEEKQHNYKRPQPCTTTLDTSSSYVLCLMHTGKPKGVVVSHCLTWFQTQPILTTCQIHRGGIGPLHTCHPTVVLGHSCSYPGGWDDHTCDAWMYIAPSADAQHLHFGCLAK